MIRPYECVHSYDRIRGRLLQSGLRSIEIYLYTFEQITSFPTCGYRWNPIGSANDSETLPNCAAAVETQKKVLVFDNFCQSGSDFEDIFGRFLSTKLLAIPFLCFQFENLSTYRKKTF